MLFNLCIIFGIFCVSSLLFIAIYFFGFGYTLREYDKKSRELNSLKDEIIRCNYDLKNLNEKISYSKNRLFELDKEFLEKISSINEKK